MYALCRTCRRVAVSYEFPALFGDATKVIWHHFVRPLPGEGHQAVPLSGIRQRVLLCADCRQPQTFYFREGWRCDNDYCEGSADQHP